MTVFNRLTLGVTTRSFPQIKADIEATLEDVYQGGINDLTRTELLQYLIDAMAQIGDGYFREMERATGETTLATAVEPQTVLDLAYQVYGYVPESAKASRFTVLAQVPNAKGFIIPQGLVLQTLPQDGSPVVQFEVTTDTAKPVGVSSVEFEIRQGRSVVDDPVLSTGLAGQRIPLNRADVILDTVELRVAGTLWTRVQSFAGSRPTSNHYRLVATEIIPGQRRFWALLGDGIQGRIPPAGASIQVNYVSGGGQVGNVGLGTITRVPNPITVAGAPVTMTVTNTAQLARGQDPESIDVVRVKAPLSNAIHGGVVNQRDFQYAALLNGAARAVANTRATVPAIAPNLILLVVMFDLATLPTQTELDDLRDTIQSTYRSNGTARLAVVPGAFRDHTLTIDVYPSQGIRDVLELEEDLQELANAYFSLQAVIGPIPRFAVDLGQPVLISPLVSEINRDPRVQEVRAPLTPLPVEANELARVTVTVNVQLPPTP